MSPFITTAMFGTPGPIELLILGVVLMMSLGGIGVLVWFLVGGFQPGQNAHRKTCPDCKKNASTQATCCPNCGRSLSQ